MSPLSVLDERRTGRLLLKRKQTSIDACKGRKGCEFSRSLMTSVSNISANGGNLCWAQMLANAADNRMKGMTILNMSSVDMIAGWKTGTNR
jgi:hypothetical protein